MALGARRLISTFREFPKRGTSRQVTVKRLDGLNDPVLPIAESQRD
jgi:hypothetical protein